MEEEKNVLTALAVTTHEKMMHLLLLSLARGVLLPHLDPYFYAAESRLRARNFCNQSINNCCRTI